MRALLIDDEIRATDTLHLMIDKFVPEITEIEICNDARNAFSILDHYHPDVLFLDIRMPHMTGFDLLSRIRNREFDVIFTTAFNEYAIKAIRFSALDYLLKPVDAEELIAAVKRLVEKKKNNESQNELLQNLVDNMKAGDARQLRLAVYTAEGVYFLHPSEIMHCEALSNYTRFYLQNGRHFITSKTLKEYTELLESYGFIRTHKSHLVNKAFIAFIDTDGYIHLKDSSKIELARRKKDFVLEQLKQI